MGRFVFPYIHVLKTEFECPCCHSLPPDLYVDGRYYSFFEKWELLRSEWGKPISISKGGGWRCPRYQYRLIKDGKTTATVSPHSFFALDNDFNTTYEVYRFVNLVEELFPQMRMGFDKYLEQGKTFVHIDEVFLIKPRPSLSWIPGYRW